VFARLVRLDIANLLRDRRLAATLTAFSAVFALAGIAAWREVQAAAETKAAVAEAERQRWLSQGERDPHTAAHYSIYAFKPSLALQAVDAGIVPFVGEAVWLEAHLQNDLLFRPQQDATVFERLGLVDPAGLFVRFAPLAVFLLAFAAAAREREPGVLGLALGMAPTRSAYLGAKVASVAGLGVLATVVPIVAIGALSTATNPSGSAEQAGRLAGWAAGAVAYVAIMSTIAVSICALARSVQVACSALVFAWVALVLAALPAASAVAEWSRPLPSFQEMKLVLVDEAPAYWTPESGAEQIATILRQYGAPDVDALAAKQINVRGAQLDLAERRAQAVFDREISGFYDRLADQDRAYARLGWLSPAIAFDVASAALTGTDFTHHRDFIDAAERYRRALVNRLNSDLIPKPAVGGREHTNNADLWSQVPAFEYMPLPLSTGVAPSLAALAALVCWLAGGAALVAHSATHVRP